MKFRSYENSIVYEVKKLETSLKNKKKQKNISASQYKNTRIINKKCNLTNTNVNLKLTTFRENCHHKKTLLKLTF